MSTLDQFRKLIRTKGYVREEADAWAKSWFAGDKEVVASSVAQVLVTRFGGSCERLGPATRFNEDLAVNEVERVQLLLALEEEFNLAISDEAAEAIQTVSQLVSYLFGRIQAAAVATQCAGEKVGLGLVLARDMDQKMSLILCTRSVKGADDSPQMVQAHLVQRIGERS